MRHTVYTIRYIPEDRVVYVGYTNDFETRMMQHYGGKTNTKRMIEELGAENLTMEAYGELQTKEEALKLEDELIVRYRTIEEGYNKVRSGGISLDHTKYCYIERQKPGIKEKIEAYQKTYQKAYHKTDKFLAYQRDYYQKHKDKFKEKYEKAKKIAG